MTEAADGCCRTCASFEGFSGADKGLCRRNPPAFVTGDDTNEGYWPVIYENDWCGEYLYSGPNGSARP